MLLKTVGIHSICQAHQGTLIHVSSSLHHPVVLYPKTGIQPQQGCLFPTPQSRGKKAKANPTTTTTTNSCTWLLLLF